MMRDCATLGELVACCGGAVRTGPFGSQLHRQDYVDDSEATPVIMPKDMIEGRVDTSSIARIDDETVERLKQHVLRPRDIVLARRGDIGRRAWIGDNEAGWLCGTGSMRISLPDCCRLRARYLYYYLATERAVGWLEGHSVGATMSNLSAGVVEQLPVELPSIEVQDRVVGVLDSLGALIDDNRQRIEILEEVARLVYREWFVDFRFPGHEDVELVDSQLGPIPKGWERGLFGDLVEVSREAASPDEIEPGEPLVGLEHLPRRSTTLHDWDRTDEVGSRKSLFVKGDILFGKIRPYFHKVALAPINGYCSTDAIVFRPEPEGRWQALAVASSDEFVAHAVQTSNGTKMPRANTDVLLQYPVPIPRPEVGQAFEAVAGPMNLLCENLSVQIRLLREARDLLLPRLISGKLDVSVLDLDLEPVA